MTSRTCIGQWSGYSLLGLIHWCKGFRRLYLTGLERWWWVQGEWWRNSGWIAGRFFLSSRSICSWIIVLCRLWWSTWFRGWSSFWGFLNTDFSFIQFRLIAFSHPRYWAINPALIPSISHHQTPLIPPLNSSHHLIKPQLFNHLGDAPQPSPH